MFKVLSFAAFAGIMFITQPVRVVGIAGTSVGLTFGLIGVSRVLERGFIILILESHGDFAPWQRIAIDCRVQ